MRKRQMGFIGEAFDSAIRSLLIFGVIVGAALATLVWVVIPWVWGWLKPLIHGWTA